MPPVAYPHELESYWLNLAQTETRGVALRDTLQRLRPDIKRLADRFTTARPATDTLPDYLRDTRDCAAYAVFFAPQTHARLTHILAELPPFPPTPQPLRVLDLGCGTGAASFALLDHLGPRPVLLHAHDRSRAALRCLHECFSTLRASRWPAAMLRTQAATLEETAADGPFDVILLHYVLNELTPALRRSLLARAREWLAPLGRLIICEPLLREAGDYMRELRTFALTDLGLHLLAPCPHEQTCPLAEPCHDVRTWKVPQSLQIVNNLLPRDLRHLAYALLVLSPAPSPAPDGVIRARLVGSPTFAKGQTLCPACCSNGAIHRLQLLTRDFDTAGRKNLRHLERGQILRLASLSPLPDSSLSRARPAPAEAE